MGFLTSLFGGSGNEIVTIGLALGIVVVLIVLGVWVLKLLFNATGSAGRGRNKRLAVVDVTPVDQKRQLLLVRRDDVEHLILIGGQQDLVIETGIQLSDEPAMAERPPRRQEAAPPRSVNNVTKVVAPVSAAVAAAPVMIPAAESTQEPIEAAELSSNENKISVDPAKIFDSEPLEGKGRKARSPLKRLRDLDIEPTDKRVTSLRHTGLLRPANRVEPAVLPQSSMDVSQKQEPTLSDSAKNDAKAAKPAEGAGVAAHDNDVDGGVAGKQSKSDGTTGVAS